MKNNIKKLIVGVVAVFGFILMTPFAFAGTPELDINSRPVTTNYNSVRFSVHYNTKGDTLSSVTVKYGLNASMSNPTSYQTPTSSEGDLYFGASNLVNGKTYYFQAVGLSSSKTVFSSRYTFVFKDQSNSGNPNFGNSNNLNTNVNNNLVPVGMPIATTKIATSITKTSATLNGSFDGNGGMVDTWFEYGISSTNLNKHTPGLSQSNIKGSDSEYLTGLTEGTTYYYRIVVRNITGTTNGSIVSFTTDSSYIPPANNCSITNFSSNDYSITKGDSITISWATSNCTNVSAREDGVEFSTKVNESSVRYLSSATTYVLNASNSTSSDSDSFTVTVIVFQILIRTQQIIVKLIPLGLINLL